MGRWTAEQHALRQSISGWSDRETAVDTIIAATAVMPANDVHQVLDQIATGLGQYWAFFCRGIIDSETGCFGETRGVRKLLSVRHRDYTYAAYAYELGAGQWIHDSRPAGGQPQV